MDEKAESRSEPQKKRYLKPELRQVPLRPEEAVLGNCKVAGTSGPGIAGSCKIAGKRFTLGS